MKYKLLVLDVDGTLVESKQDGQLSTKVIETIHKIKDKIKISLCTGRPYSNIKHIINTLGINNSFHIVETGAKVINPEGKIEYGKYLKEEEIKYIVESTINFSRYPGLCIDGKWEREDTIKKVSKKNITIVSLHPANRKQIDEIISKLDVLKDKINYHVGSSWNPLDCACVHITNKEASKEFGLSYVQKKLKIIKGETIGVGDMPNDLPLFKMSGLKVAMGNGSQDLKNVADAVAPPLSEDGVAWVINKFIL